MSKIWILEHIDNAGIKFYYIETYMGPCYVADINSAHIFHSETEVKSVQASLVACKPKIVQVNIVPHVSNNK